MTNGATFQVRPRRKYNYWEAIYNPGISSPYGEGDWSFTTNVGPHLQVFTSDGLVKALSDGKSHGKFKKITFQECDFSGDFRKIERAIIFDECIFILCDFGLTTWERAKFSKCQFERTSFTQSSLYSCEFRDCTWKQISFSGNETRLQNTYIDNPGSFIAAGWTNLDKLTLTQKGRNRLEQRARLEETKSTVARNIYNNLKFIGDERPFYDACKISTIQSLRSQVRRATAMCVSAPRLVDQLRGAINIPIFVSEFWLTSFFGFSNKWGASVGRPLFLLALSVGIFTLMYHFISGLAWPDAGAKSVEIGLIAGYTRVANEATIDAVRTLEWFDLAVSLVFYTTFLATIVAKISKVR